MYVIYSSHLLINQVSLRKTLVIKMMNVSVRAVGRAGVNISFPEHNSESGRNILMVLGRIIEQAIANCRCEGEDDNSAYLCFLITSNDSYFT